MHDWMTKAHFAETPVGTPASHQPLHEPAELLHVAQGWAVAGAEQLRLERPEAADGVAVLGGVEGECPRWLANEADDASEVIVAVDDVADEGDAIGFAQEGDLPGGVAGHVVDGEAGDAVAFF